MELVSRRIGGTLRIGESLTARVLAICCEQVSFEFVARKCESASACSDDLLTRILDMTAVDAATFLALRNFLPP